MKVMLLTLLFSFSSWAAEFEGHLRYENTTWNVRPLDKSAPAVPGPLCLHSDFKEFKDLFVRVKVNDKRNGKCFDVVEIAPTVLDPLGGSLKPYRKQP